MARENDAPFLSISHLTKSFDGNSVLKDITLQIRPGEFHTFAGENGAGKSTLINLICGIHRPDSGTIEVNGSPIERMTPLKAAELGISVVHQELSLFPHLSIAQNIFLGREMCGRGGILCSKRMNAQTADMLKKVGLSHLNPETPIGELSLAEQQLVEFTKTLFQNPKLLVLDEVTSALAPEQVRTIFDLLIERRQSNRLCAIFITHRLSEIFELCDAMTILKDGEQVVTRSLEGQTVDDIVKYMTGRQLSGLFPPKQSAEAVARKKPILEVRSLCTRHLRDISFVLRETEILGIGGLQGQGQQELMEAMFGVEPVESGNIVYKGRRVNYRHSASSMKDGWAYLPAKRNTDSLFLPFGIRENVGFINMNVLSGRTGTVSSRSELQMTKDGMKKFNIKARGTEQTVLSLSGGNQQKVVLAKWLARDPCVILLNDPTRGIDVGTKQEIYAILRSLVQNGKSIVLISTDTMELIGLCDSVVVLYEHRVNGVLQGNALTEENLVHASVVKGERNYEAAV
jgi:ABC-type sugar transport system ATPase subunit